MPIKEYKLYNDTITIGFNESRHIYYDGNGKRLLSVTGATGVVDKSGPLMGWVAKMMGIYLTDNWDIEKIKKESEKIALIDTAKREYRRAKKEAADIGTEIHKWIEEWITGKKPEMPDNEKVVNGITAFLKFQKEHKFKWLDSERLVYSKKHNFVGLLDATAMAGKEFVMVDFKSSNALYDEMRFQVAAYRLAYEEETGKKFDKSMLIRFGKEDGEFEVYELDNYEKDRKAFLSCLALRRRLNELK